MGILTDGRSISQRNKIRALGLESWINKIVVSEEFGSAKPDERNFRHFHKVFPQHRSFAYIGDNPAKDFVTPNRLGWSTICLVDQGKNIHPQQIERFPVAYHPQFLISKIA